jgi:hypothetical protein
LKRFLTILLFLALTGCSPASALPPSPTIRPATKITATPTYTPCAYVAGSKDAPKLTATFAEKLKAADLPIEKVRAEAYGENCITADNSIISFGQREIDFYITLNVSDLKDYASLGSQLEKIFVAIDELPANQTGPNPGYVGVTFQSGTQVKNLWFLLTDASALRKHGTKGADLYKALTSAP